MKEQELLQEIKKQIIYYAKNNNPPLDLSTFSGRPDTDAKKLKWFLNQIEMKLNGISQLSWQEIVTQFKPFFPELSQNILKLISENNFLNNKKDIASAFNSPLLQDRNDELDELSAILKNLLSEENKDINAMCSWKGQNVTLLWMAVELNNREAVQKLLQAGADPNIRYGDNQKTILMDAISKAIAKIDKEDMFGSEELDTSIIEELINFSGVDPTIEDARKDNLFNYALDNSELMKLLFEKYKGQMEIYIPLAAATDIQIKDFFEQYNDSSDVNKKLDAFLLIARYGQLLGLDGKISFTLNKNNASTTLPFKFEGSTSDRSLPLLVDLLNAYKNTEIKEIYQASLHGKNEDISNFYKMKDICYIDSGWYGHTVSVILCGNYIAVCNRGEHGDQDFGTIIYPLKNIQNKDIKDLLNDFKTSSRTYQQFKDNLSKFVDVDRPVVKMPHKGQEHGNCSFANPKSSMTAIKLFLNAQENNLMDDLPAAYKNCKSKIESEYKAFTKFMREYGIDELIKTMKNDATSLEQFYVDLVANIIIQHSGTGSRRDEKAEDDRKRAFRLFMAAPENIQIMVWKSGNGFARDRLCDISKVLDPDKGLKFIRDFDIKAFSNQKKHGLHFAYAPSPTSPSPTSPSQGNLSPNIPEVAQLKKPKG